MMQSSSRERVHCLRHSQRVLIDHLNADGGFVGLRLAYVFGKGHLPVV